MTEKGHGVPEHSQRNTRARWASLKKFRLLLVFLVVPLICFFLVSDSRSKLDGAWNDALQKAMPADRASELVLSRACSDVDLRQAVDINAVCEAYYNIDRLQTLAVFLGIVPVLLAALLVIAGFVSKGNRNSLRLLFRPGFVMSSLLIALQLLAQGALLSGTVLYAFSKGVKDENFYFYSALFGVIAVLGGFFTIRPLFNQKRAAVTVIGRSVHAVEYPKLWRFIKHLADQTGTECPQNVIVGLTPNFFVTEADVYCIGKKLTGRSMYLSLPLCRVLTIEELSAITVHELAHFKGEDTAFSLAFYPVYRRTIASINGVAETANAITNFGRYIPIGGIRLITGLGALTLFPSLYMLNFFLECFAEAENAISRDRELAADGLAASNIGPLNTATALVKIHAFAGVWESVTSAVRDGLLAGYIDVDGQRYEAQSFFANVSELFAIIVNTHASEPSALDGLDATTIPHPTDSHPPLSVRLGSLRKELREIRGLALSVCPDLSSADVIDNYEALELELSAVELALMNPQELPREELALAS